MRLFGRLAVASLLALVTWGPAWAAELAPPSGPVVLTLAGEIGETNRPAFDPFEDSFLSYHERSFEKAAAFDRAMLESLGLQEVTLSYSAWPRPLRLEGPRLSDLLAAVGASGRAVTVVALDGYAIDISAEEVARLPWIVALKAEGDYLDIGGRGPTWVVYDPGGAASAEDEARWGWAIFYIEVR